MSPLQLGELKSEVEGGPSKPSFLLFSSRERVDIPGGYILETSLPRSEGYTRRGLKTFWVLNA